MRDRVTDYLVSYATSMTYEDLPDEVVLKAKGLVLDSLGCALGAYASEPPRIARQMARRVSAVEMPASILGSGAKSSPELATFANGVMVRYLDFMDAYTISGGHPSDVFAPIFTCGEATHVSGKDFILALVIGYEVFCGLSEQIERPKGFDPAGISGILGSAIGASKILGLTAEQTKQAVNLAVAPAIALGQTRVGDVSMWKGCALANIARNAVFAALLARDGMTGPAPIFEGRNGLMNAVTGPFELNEFGGRDRHFRIADVSMKLYPCCVLGETAVDAAIQLRSNVPDVDDIAEINVGTFGLAKSVTAGDAEKWHPTTRETADHSLPYVVAAALKYGALEIRHFDDEFLRDPGLLSLIERVTVTESEECNSLRPKASPSRVELVMKSGERHSQMVPYWRGHYLNPFSTEEIEGKFAGLATGVLTQRQRDNVLSLVWGLDTLDDIGLIAQQAVGH